MILVNWLISALAVYLTAWMLPGITLKNFWTAMLVTLVLAVLNVLVKPFLLFVSLPVTVLTLGLFIFVIDSLIILMANWLLDSFVVQNFWWALTFSVILSLVTNLLNKIL